MNKRGIFNWCVWISLASGIYCLIYASIPWLFNQGVMPVTFVALPIYLISGCKRGEFFNFAASSVLGVVWGCAFFFGTGWFMAKTGLHANVSNLIVVFVICFVCCFLHMGVTGNTWFNKVPAMFGAISVTLSNGAVNIVALMITLLGGVVLALVCNEGQFLLTEEGKWRFFQKKSAANS